MCLQITDNGPNIVEDLLYEGHNLLGLNLRAELEREREREKNRGKNAMLVLIAKLLIVRTCLSACPSVCLLLAVAVTR